MTPYIIYIINKIRYIPPSYIFFEKKIKKTCFCIYAFCIFDSKILRAHLHALSRENS